MTAPISKAEWEALRRESIGVMPDLAEKLGLPNVLLPYQGDTVAELESGTALLVIEKSRRVGLTWGLASYAVLRAARAKSAGGMDGMYISYSQEMTREFVDACAMWARAYAVAAADVQEFIFDDVDPKSPDETRKIQAFRIQFASGFEILALSSAPRSLRGKQGLVIIDEAAFVDNLKELLKAALAFLMWGGQVVVCSTHNGAENDFNLLVQDILGERRKGRHKRIDFDQALQDGLYQRICLVTGKEWSPEAEAAWRQDIIDFYSDGADEELFCVPSMGSGAWLTAPLIEARMTLDPDEAPILRVALPADYLQRPETDRRHLLAAQIADLDDALKLLSPKNLHALGYDPARMNDPAVITLLAVDGILHRRTALTVEFRNVPFDEQKAIARQIIRATPRLVGAAVDATGMGMNLAEDLGREFGFYIPNEDPSKVVYGLVWQVKLSTGWYNEHMPPVKVAFEDGAIALTRDVEHLADLRLVKVIRGIPSIPEERVNVAGKKRHGDFAVALVLAYAASRLQWHEYGYTPVGRPASRFEERSEDDSFTMRPRGEGSFRMASMRRSRGTF
ncbi:MAG: terminase family protein [Pseudomonadota bacterium]